MDASRTNRLNALRNVESDLAQRRAVLAVEMQYETEREQERYQSAMLERAHALLFFFPDHDTSSCGDDADDENPERCDRCKLLYLARTGVMHVPFFVALSLIAVRD